VHPVLCPSPPQAKLEPWLVAISLVSFTWRLVCSPFSHRLLYLCKADPIVSTHPSSVQRSSLRSRSFPVAECNPLYTPLPRFFFRVVQHRIGAELFRERPRFFPFFFHGETSRGRPIKRI